MRSGILLAGLFVACSTAGICAAQEALPPAVPFDQVLGTGTVDPQLLWRRLLSTDYRFGATTHGLGTYFETAVVGEKSDGARGAFYCQVDGNSDRCVRYTPGDEQAPGMLSIDNHHFLLDASRIWEHRTHKHWSHLLDSAHFENPSRPVLSEETSSIRVDLGGYLSCASPVVSQYSWDPATLTLMVVKATGSKWRIKFRTPVDQRRFGTILSELHLRGGAAGGAVDHRCFIVDRASPLRINIGTAKDIAVSLNARDRDPSGPPLKFLEISGPEDRKQALALSLLVNHLPNDDPRPTQFPDSRSRYHEILPGYLVAYGKDVSPAIDGTKRYPFINEFIAALVEELEIAQTCIETTIAPDGGPVDDPCLKWLALERGITPRMADLLCGELCARLLHWRDAPLESRVALSIAISEFGPPIKATLGRFLRDDADILLHAVVHARWGWLPTDAELEECVRLVNEKDAGAVLRLAAIDSLVRWGKFENVSEESLALWFSSRLAGSDATRSSTIRCLARSTKGRALLCESYRKGDRSDRVASQVAAILRSHATATLELKRFEFMPEAECRTVLELCDRVEKRSAASK